MLPRRKKKPEAAPETKAADSIIEMLQTQIDEERTKQARPSSRTQPDRKIITKKKQKPAEPTQPKTQSPPRPKPRYATTETVTGETTTTETSVSAPDHIKPLAATGFSYFDRLTERSIFDDPLKDFPGLRKHLDPK